MRPQATAAIEQRVACDSVQRRVTWTGRNPRPPPATHPVHTHWSQSMACVPLTRCCQVLVDEAQSAVRPRIVVSNGVSPGSRRSGCGAVSRNSRCRHVPACRQDSVSPENTAKAATGDRVSFHRSRPWHFPPVHVCSAPPARTSVPPRSCQRACSRRSMANPSASI